MKTWSLSSAMIRLDKITADDDRRCSDTKECGEALNTSSFDHTMAELKDCNADVMQKVVAVTMDDFSCGSPAL